MEFNVQNAFSVIENIDQKIPLGDFCAKLRELNLPSSNSWRRTKELLADILESRLTEEQEVSMCALLSWIDSYIRHSSKAVYIYKLNPDFHGQTDQVERDFIGHSPNLIRVDYPRSYPSLLGKEEMAEFNGAFCLRALSEHAGFTDVVFSHVKEYQARDEIHVTADEAQAVERLTGYSKIIGIRSALHEHVDVLRFNRQAGTVELYLDITRPGPLPCNQAEISRRAKDYANIVNSAVKMGNHNFELPSSLNLFGSIKRIYDSLEGSICELGFALTVSGSVKTEKMKRASSDLRSEPWHAAGMGAVNKEEVDMYRLSVCWDITGSDDRPILSIPGNYKSLSLSEIDYAIIAGCKEKVSFDFAFSRLINFAA